MPYPLKAFCAIVVFSIIHLFADRTRKLEKFWHGAFLSACGGVSIAYVFIDLLPKLSKSDQLVRSTLIGVFPFLEKHVYIMALGGFLFFFAIDRLQKSSKNNVGFVALTMSSYAFFNFLVGYAVVDKDNPEFQPLLLFTFAMGLHYFVNDYTINEKHKTEYHDFGKALLICSLFLGFMTGILFQLSEVAIALVSAFIGGGVIMNVIRHELPQEKPHSLTSFVAFSCLYAIILLSIGS